MFAQLDKELRFGYQTNGSLVVAFNENDLKHLDELKKRGETNGVQNLRIVDQQELRKMEPHINEEAIAALYSPDAGNVIPYVSLLSVLFFLSVPWRLDSFSRNQWHRNMRLPWPKMRWIMAWN